MNSRRIFFLLYVVLLAAFGIGAGAMLLDARAEYVALKQVQAANRAKLAAAQAQLRERERTLERLRSDPKFVEKEIRTRLGYAQQGEVIYRFPE